MELIELLFLVVQVISDIITTKRHRDYPIRIARLVNTILGKDFDLCHAMNIVCFARDQYLQTQNTTQYMDP